MSMCRVTLGWGPINLNGLLILKRLLMGFFGWPITTKNTHSLDIPKIKDYDVAFLFSLVIQVINWFLILEKTFWFPRFPSKLGALFGLRWSPCPFNLTFDSQ